MSVTVPQRSLLRPNDFLLRPVFLPLPPRIHHGPSYALTTPPPASSDVCAPGPFLCSCGSTIDADESPFHCLDCSGSQFFNIHRHHAVRDTTIDLLNNVSSSHTSILSVLPKEPLLLTPADKTSVTDLCDEARGHNTILQDNLSPTFAPVAPSPGTLDRPGPTAVSSPPPTGGISI